MLCNVRFKVKQYLIIQGFINLYKNQRTDQRINHCVNT